MKIPLGKEVYIQQQTYKYVDYDGQNVYLDQTKLSIDEVRALPIDRSWVMRHAPSLFDQMLNSKIKPIHLIGHWIDGTDIKAGSPE